MGFCCMHGIAFPKNTTRALELLTKAQGSHLDAGFLLGEYYMSPGAGGGGVFGKSHDEIARALQSYTFSAGLGNGYAHHR